jgi:hypothetical protein
MKKYNNHNKNYYYNKLLYNINMCLLKYSLKIKCIIKKKKKKLNNIIPVYAFTIYLIIKKMFHR